MLGRDPESRRGAALPARPPDEGRRGRRRCRSAAATSCSSTSSWTRSASTRPAGTSSAAATTRRSRSTSTSPPRRAQKNPVYYVQYAHARIAGILRNAGEAAASARGAGRRWPPEERELIKRLAEFPGVVAEATERRGPARDPHLRDPRRRRLPPLLPRAQGARQRGRGVPARPLPRDALGDRALPRPDRGRGARPDVSGPNSPCAGTSPSRGSRPRGASSR